MKINIRLIYLYLFSFVGLLVVVIGSVRLLELGLKVVVFKDADVYEVPMTLTKTDQQEVIDPIVDQARQQRETKRQRERELSGSLAMIAVGLALYLYHWKTIQRENK